VDTQLGYALERFSRHIPYRVRASKRKYGQYEYDRSFALQRFPYVQVNSLDMVHYVVFDIDHEYGEFADAVLELPSFTIAVVNPRNGHSHVLYEIDQYPAKVASAKSKQLMRFVTRGYRKLLDADRVITAQSLAKNPLSPKWKTYGSGQPHTLSELAESLQSRTERRQTVAELDPLSFERALDQSSRNCSLFNFSRFHAYHIVNQVHDLEHLCAEVIKILDQANRIDVPRYFDLPLPPAELVTIAKSVSKWTWVHRDQFRLRNEGAMGLPSMKGTYRPPAEWEQEVKARQKAGGKYAAEKRKETSRMLITSSLEKLHSSLCRMPSMSDVQRDTGLSYKTVQRHKSLFPQSSPNRS
jgi:hypothetical protein